MSATRQELPGDNELTLQAEQSDGLTLQADWAWTQGQDEKCESVILKPGEKIARRTINPQASRPEDLHMRGVTLRCLPAT